MVNVKITDKVKVYYDGVLIIDGKNYNDIKSTVYRALKIIQDSYQLSILKQILEEVA